MAEYNTPEFTRYADAHKELKGAGDARPTAIQIVKDNDLEGTIRGSYDHNKPMLMHSRQAW